MKLCHYLGSSLEDAITSGLHLPLQHPTKALKQHAIRALDPACEDLHFPFCLRVFSMNQSQLNTYPKRHFPRGRCHFHALLPGKLHLTTCLSRPNILGSVSQTSTELPVPRPVPRKRVQLAIQRSNSSIDGCRWKGKCIINRKRKKMFREARNPSCHALSKISIARRRVKGDNGPSWDAAHPTTRQEPSASFFPAQARSRHSCGCYFS